MTKFSIFEDFKKGGVVGVATGLGILGGNQQKKTSPTSSISEDFRNTFFGGFPIGNLTQQPITSAKSGGFQLGLTDKVVLGLIVSIIGSVAVKELIK